jgi:hypothetical protein
MSMNLPKLIDSIYKYGSDMRMFNEFSEILL